MKQTDFPYKLHACVIRHDYEQFFVIYNKEIFCAVNLQPFSLDMKTWVALNPTFYVYFMDGSTVMSHG